MTEEILKYNYNEFIYEMAGRTGYDEASVHAILDPMEELIRDILGQVTEKVGVDVKITPHIVLTNRYKPPQRKILPEIGEMMSKPGYMTRAHFTGPMKNIHDE